MPYGSEIRDMLEGQPCDIKSLEGRVEYWEFTYVLLKRGWPAYDFTHIKLPNCAWLLLTAYVTNSVQQSPSWEASWSSSSEESPRTLWKLND